MGKRKPAKRKPSKRKSIADPYRKREARRYEFPIPSREYILSVLKDNSIPLTFEEIASLLELQQDQERHGLERRLQAMCRDGQIVCNRKGGYCLVNKQDLIHGRVIAHPDGFGFLQPDDGSKDLFIVPSQMRALWHDDRVVVRVSGMDNRGRREAAVVEILERAHQQIVGRLRFERGIGFVVPDNKRLLHDILIPGDFLGEAQKGQMVVTQILEHPDKRHRPVGEIVEILGEHMAPGMATDVALRTYEIPYDWPESVESEIAGLKPEVSESQVKNRTDLRDVPLVTIDGADARDFDDAVYCKKTNNGWRLLVCIADVSAYVLPGSALDEEALNRATSVYFPDRVVPMLPEVLSNGLCSLNPGVDRLCMTAELIIGEDGHLVRSRFYPSVMRSHARLTYDEVGAMLLEGDAELCEKYADLLPDLHQLYALYQVLKHYRQRQGAIDFDTTETRFQFDKHGMLTGIHPVDRHDAHKLIEECMLCANIAAARYLIRKRVPSMFRVHEKPSEEKLVELHDFLGQLGLQLNGGLEPTAKDYADLMQRIQNREDAHLIQTVLLRSMMQARYTTEQEGHFGLGFQAYTHFTSPIRRYPDLMVHRAIRHMLIENNPNSFAYSHADVSRIAEHCSTNERRADDATRDSADTLKCEYMLDKIGNDYQGTIVSVNSFGLFVELDEIFVTGLVHVTALDYDYFHFDPVAHRLTGERSGKSYRLADKLRVKVAAVNLDERKIDLVLIDVKTKGRRKKKKKRR